MNKTWLLNREALNIAKQSIEIIEKEVGVRLKLADPDFLGLLGDYVGLLESTLLSDAVLKLYQCAGISEEFQPFKSENLTIASKYDVIQFYGKTYPRYQNEKEFKHLYRGHPVYA